MPNPARISVQEAWAQMLSPAPPLLVCAYEDDAKFRMFRLEGAVPFSEFQAKLPSLGKNRSIIFY